MRVYLDNCCYNRPFDEQSQLAVRLETEAKMRVQSLMRCGDLEYAWSSVLEYEIAQSPFIDRAEQILPWRSGAAMDVVMDQALIARGSEIMEYGIKKMDALHLACAERAMCDWFLTLDKGILRKVDCLGGILVANPVDFIVEERI